MIIEYPSMSCFRNVFLVKYIVGFSNIAWNVANLLPAALYFIELTIIARVQRLQIVPVGALCALQAACLHFITILLRHTS